MTGLYKIAGLSLYSPTTHLLRFCSMPAAYKKRSITRKRTKGRRSLKGFMTPSVSFAERWFIEMENISKMIEKSLLSSLRCQILPGTLHSNSFSAPIAIASLPLMKSYATFFWKTVLFLTAFFRLSVVLFYASINQKTLFLVLSVSFIRLDAL